MKGTLEGKIIENFKLVLGFKFSVNTFLLPNLHQQHTVTIKSLRAS